MARSVLFIVAAFSLLTTCRTHLVQIQWREGGWIAVSPGPAHPFPPIQEADLDSDGIAERMELREGQLRLTKNNEIVWASPSQWKVQTAQFADLNRDQIPEIALLVWRPFAPWPVDAWLPEGGRIADFHDADNQSCHIILWGWAGEKFRELWAGSALAEPILDFSAADWNGDGRQELLAAETEYSHPERGNAISLWEWNGFGFSLIDRLKTDFHQFAFLTGEDNQPFVLVNPSDWFFKLRRKQND